MRKLGYIRCELAIYTHSGPNHSCPEWKPAEAEIVDKRREWLAQRSD